MSAAAQARPSTSRRKPPKSSDESKIVPYFPYPHKLVDEIQWVASSWCEHQALHKILSLVNQREAFLLSVGRPLTGASVLISLADLAEGSRWELRRWQDVVKALAAGDQPVIEQITREEALEADLLTKQEAGKKREGVYVFRVCRQNWPAIAEANREIDRLAREAVAKKAAAEEVPAAEERRTRGNIRLTDAPIIHMPGGKVERLDLSEAAQDAIGGVTQIRPKFDCTSAIAIEFEIRDEVLQYRISDPPPLFHNSTGRVKGEGPTHSSAFVKRHVVHSNGKHKNGNGQNGHSAAAPEFTDLELSTLRDAIDQELLATVGKPIDDVMLAGVAEDMGSLDGGSIDRLVGLIRKNIRKIYSHGYLTPDGLAAQVRKTTRRARELDRKARNSRCEASAEPSTLERAHAYIERTAAKLPPEHSNIVSELKSLVGWSGDLDLLDQKLATIEQAMISQVSAAQGKDERAALDRDAEGAIQAYRSKMSEEQLALLRAQYLERRLFEQSSLPRLGLFYM